MKASMNAVVCVCMYIYSLIIHIAMKSTRMRARTHTHTHTHMPYCSGWRTTTRPSPPRTSSVSPWNAWVAKVVAAQAPGAATRARPRRLPPTARSSCNLLQLGRQQVPEVCKSERASERGCERARASKREREGERERERELVMLPFTTAAHARSREHASARER